MAGIGHLSRSLGLTLDAIISLRGVRADGEQFLITAESDDQELWTLLRGAALFLAVITEAELSTFPRQPLSVLRVINKLDLLEEAIAAAETLDVQASCSMILAVPPDKDMPFLLVYGVAAEAHRQLLQAIPAEGLSWKEKVDGLEVLPAFEMPLVDGTVLAPLPIQPDRHKRDRTWTYSINLPGGIGKQLSGILLEALQTLPNRHSRIDLQHIGGIVSEIPIDQPCIEADKRNGLLLFQLVGLPLTRLQPMPQVLGLMLSLMPLSLWPCTTTWWNGTLELFGIKKNYNLHTVLGSTVCEHAKPPGIQMVFCLI